MGEGKEGVSGIWHLGAMRPSEDIGALENLHRIGLVSQGDSTIIILNESTVDERTE